MSMYKLPSVNSPYASWVESWSEFLLRKPLSFEHKKKEKTGNNASERNPGYELRMGCMDWAFWDFLGSDQTKKQ